MSNPPLDPLAGHRTGLILRVIWGSCLAGAAGAMCLYRYFVADYGWAAFDLVMAAVAIAVTADNIELLARRK